MRDAVYFYDQQQFLTHEIGNVVEYGALPSELVALHLAGAKDVFPQAGFSLGHVFSEAAGKML